MGRAFEFRKERKFKRWDKMAKQFTKIGREIAIAVKESGPIPENNPRLRTAIQNAKGVNMPKDRVEAAIKRASDKNAAAFEEVLYEGKGPSGVGIVVETATDNPTRTVANVRMYFSRNGGELGKTGSLSYLFDRKGLFKVDKNDFDPEEMELELIDFGLEEIVEKSKSFWIYTNFEDFGNMQKALEERNINVLNSELVRIPNSTVELDEENTNTVLELIDKLEQDDDVQNVFHNLDLGEEDDDEEEASN
ncbi:YebC/PmpR family DNA-binding transcriptional regulator [Luteibaculum oceani]|uniref:Probable transcriptional regulatory protein FRX97_09005 n=1 Tax=Luteibaculum oceani TaxID=1294296 RepID=A0A5C6V0R7_9FLAO|nr:YebC/PmpR family DNA-binding transcriptional regulator [Luteibaculum oceani]TXC78460.1 YebC/PmpR family DNA-binding transcriptional regulator [Luteibaculum oceani]